MGDDDLIQVKYFKFDDEPFNFGLTEKEVNEL
jgi:hypothetical protein